MLGSESVQLPVKWQWQFMVKTKEQYGLNDFNAEYVPVTQHTSDFRQLIVTLNDFPPLDKMYSANIALFREGVENKWEHARNCGAKCVQFTINRADLSEESLNWFFTVLTTICLLNKQNAVNGLYIRIKSNPNDEKSHIYIFQVWVNNQPGQSAEVKEELVKKLTEFANKVQFLDGSRCGDPNTKETAEDGTVIKYKGLAISDLNNRSRFSTVRKSDARYPSDQRTPKPYLNSMASFKRGGNNTRQRQESEHTHDRYSSITQQSHYK